MPKVRDTPDGGQPKIDRRRRISPLFEVNPDDGALPRMQAEAPDRRQRPVGNRT